MGLAIAITLRTFYRDAWKPDGFVKMLANKATSEAILAGRGLAEVEAVGRDGLLDFRVIRAKYLIYPEGR